MVHTLTIQQQVAALKKSIHREHDNYTRAVEQGEANNTLEEIGNRIKKLILVLECVYRIDVEKKKISSIKELEIVDNYEQKIAS